MTRLIHLYLTWPILLLGALLSCACLASIWWINRLQADISSVTAKDFHSLSTAQALETELRQMRFLTLMRMARDTPEIDQKLIERQQSFGDNIREAERIAQTPEEAVLVREIQQRFTDYQNNLDTDNAELRSAADLQRWSEKHRVASLIEPCRVLADISNQRITATLERSELQTRWAGRALLLLGLGGPVGGLLCGVAISRGFHRRVTALSVRVQAVQSQLDQEIGMVNVEMPASLQGLDTQLERVVEGVRGVIERLQQQERERLRAEQLAAVGQLAAGVAHEVRNPITGVKLLVEAALQPGGTSLQREDLEMIQQEISRVERTVQGLLDFAKSPSAHRQSRDIRETLTRAVELVRPRARQQQVEMNISLPEAPVTSVIDPDQITSLLVNLFLNALDAMPKSGCLEIRLQPCQSKQIRLTVADSGPGIPPEVSDKLFHPFISTKHTGTGLGLSVARRVAQDHGGALTATNRASGGALFTLTLPGKGTAANAEAVGSR